MSAVTYLQSVCFYEMATEQAAVADQVAQGSCCIGPCFVLLIMQQGHQWAEAGPQGFVQTAVVEAYAPAGCYCAGQTSCGDVVALFSSHCLLHT